MKPRQSPGERMRARVETRVHKFATGGRLACYRPQAEAWGMWVRRQWAAECDGRKPAVGLRDAFRASAPLAEPAPRAGLKLVPRVVVQPVDAYAPTL